MRASTAVVALAVVLAACGGAAGSSTGPTPHAVVAFNPQSYDFLATDIGAHSSPFQFTVQNSGTAATGPISFSMTGANAADFGTLVGTCTAQTGIPAGDSCTIWAQFTPNSAHGAKAAALVITPENGAAANALLSGNALAPGRFVLPSVKVFPDAPHGSFTTMTITVTNDGDSPTPQFTVSIGGPDASQFSITGSGCFGPIAAGASCDYSLRFSPTTAGPKNGQFVITPASGAAVTTASIVGNGT